MFFSFVLQFFELLHWGSLLHYKSEFLSLQTPTPEYEQQWAPNTIKTVILICNAKGIPMQYLKKLQTPTPEYEQQWAHNTIKTVNLICNAKGIPNAVAQKTVRQN